MKSYSIWGAGSSAGLFHLTQGPQVSSKFHPVTYVRFSFSWKLNNILLYVYTTFCFCNHPFVDIWVASTSWLVWVTLLWTRVCKYLCKGLAFNSFVYMLKSGITGSHNNSILNFVVNAILTSTAIVHFTDPPAVHRGSNFSTLSPALILAFW